MLSVFFTAVYLYLFLKVIAYFDGVPGMFGVLLMVYVVYPLALIASVALAEFTVKKTWGREERLWPVFAAVYFCVLFKLLCWLSRNWGPGILNLLLTLALSAVILIASVGLAEYTVKKLQKRKGFP